MTVMDWGGTRFVQRVGSVERSETHRDASALSVGYGFA
jgi:hypothetical protein